MWPFDIFSKPPLPANVNPLTKMKEEFPLLDAGIFLSFSGKDARHVEDQLTDILINWGANIHKQSSTCPMAICVNIDYGYSVEFMLNGSCIGKCYIKDHDYYTDRFGYSVRDKSGREEKVADAIARIHLDCLVRQSKINQAKVLLLPLLEQAREENKKLIVALEELGLRSEDLRHKEADPPIILKLFE